jgi:hypothetical protein
MAFCRKKRQKMVDRTAHSFYNKKRCKHAGIGMQFKSNHKKISKKRCEAKALSF